MNVAALLSQISLVVIVLVGAVLILWDDYKDGVFGKLALITLELGALANLLYVYEGYALDPLPTTVVMLFGFACFLCRHFYRFLMFRRRGHFKWER